MTSTKSGYEIITDSPASVAWDEYVSKSRIEYGELLKQPRTDEKTLHSFFERNPSWMLGAFQLNGPSGHLPYANTLISQPTLTSATILRKPDFMWLSQNSLGFSPIIIEIEKPEKLIFTKANVQSADFTQALNQINEWKAILSDDINRQLFYNTFNLSERERKKVFSPQFGLIFGRRAEFENNQDLTRLRAYLATESVHLISYDRIHEMGPEYKAQNLFCCKCSNGNYNVITIPPTFRYEPLNAEGLMLVDGFVEAIKNMELVTEERKIFLKERHSYWLEYGSSQGMKAGNLSDSE